MNVKELLMLVDCPYTKSGRRVDQLGLHIAGSTTQSLYEPSSQVKFRELFAGTSIDWCEIWKRVESCRSCSSTEN